MFADILCKKCVTTISNHNNIYGVVKITAYCIVQNYSVPCFVYLLIDNRVPCVLTPVTGIITGSFFIK